MAVGRKQLVRTLGSENIKLPQELNNSNAQSSEDKLDISKEELIRLLSLLKSELQSKEIALAAIKCEQLKRLINPIEISRSSLANTYTELQDRFKERDENNNANNVASTSRNVGNSSSVSCCSNSSSNDETKATDAPHLSASNNESQKINDQPATSNKNQQLLNVEDNMDNDRENLNILNTLLELLDQHPLLALPRDSIYCLDYNCNELSTKNYLNLKIQHLDNLINQHRRFRYYMNLRLKKSEQRFLNLTRELELERKLKNDYDRNHFKSSGKDVLLKQIDQLKEALEKEKQDKQAIVMTSLNELFDERERVEALRAKSKEVQSIDSVEKSSCEKEKMLEAEVKKINIQLEKQSLVSSMEKSELQNKIAELEAENSRLKEKLDQLEKRPQLSSSAITNQANNGVATSPNSNRSNSTSQRQPVTSPAKQAPAVASRSSVSFTTSKSSPPPPNKTVNNNPTNSTQSASSRILVNQSSSSNISGSQTMAATPRQASSTMVPSSSGMNQRPNTSHVVFKLVGNSKAEQAPVRIQPLFKSASVSSTNQQTRNLKTSSGNVSGSSGNGGQSISQNPLTRASSTATSSTQPVTKPQVPAKPAQLLDQQRSAIN